MAILMLTANGGTAMCTYVCLSLLLSFWYKHRALLNDRPAYLLICERQRLDRTLYLDNF
jgi:hypothetical protein